MSDTWSRMPGWGLVLPPSRPDSLDLGRIRAAVEHVDRSSSVAVLGSTPEFRDLLQESGFSHVMVFEKNRQHFERMTALRYYKSDEIVVQGDWLDTLPRYEGCITLMLSDLTAGNIPYLRRAEFYASIANALVPGGLFIDKNLINPSGLLSVSDLRDKYKSLPLNLITANYFSCDAIFCSELQLELQMIDTTLIYRRLRERLSGERFARLIEAAHAITPEECVWYYGRSWSSLEPEYCTALDLLAQHDLSADQPYFGRGFQFVWQR